MGNIQYPTQVFFQTGVILRGAFFPPRSQVIPTKRGFEGFGGSKPIVERTWIVRLIPRLHLGFEFSTIIGHLPIVPDLLK